MYFDGNRSFILKHQDMHMDLSFASVIDYVSERGRMSKGHSDQRAE